MRTIGAELPPDIYHIGSQIVFSPRGAPRTPHIDPEYIAAAIATFSFEGWATISVGNGTSPQDMADGVQLRCDREHVYMLTGPSLVWPVRHAVAVPEAARLSITIRFGRLSKDDYAKARRPLR